MGIGDWGLGNGDWGLGLGPNPQSAIPNTQSPIPINSISFGLYISQCFFIQYLFSEINNYKKNYNLYTFISN